jgi:hypothetical protein
MQIHFIKQFPWGDPSYFIEKIWAGFAMNYFLSYERGGLPSLKSFQKKFPYDYSWKPIYEKVKPKITTIRADIHNRWQVGRIIHFEQWLGKPYNSKCYHFAPLIPCTATQLIEIEYVRDKPVVVIDHQHFYSPLVGIDRGMMCLANNDGFETIEDFFKWFKSDYEGKIIHWTDLRY